MNRDEFKHKSRARTRAVEPRGILQKAGAIAGPL